MNPASILYHGSYTERVSGRISHWTMEPGMNLNEECLLQFLQNEGGGAAAQDVSRVDGLTANLRRVFRRNHYVSFPPAILVRRPERD